MAHLSRSKPSTSDQIHGRLLKLLVSDGTSRHIQRDFIVEFRDPMRILMDKVCRHRGTSRDDARFFWDGVRIRQHDTPESLEMRDGDKIDFYQKQLGGNEDPGSHGDEAPERVDMDESRNTPLNIAQDTQLGVHPGTPPESQSETVPSPGNASIESSGLSNEHEDSNPIFDGAGLTQDTPANENTQATPQASLDELLIEVTDESGGNEMTFKLKRHTPMRKAMLSYCAWGDVRCKTFFVHAGRRISPNDTPDSLQLKDGAQISLHAEQTVRVEYFQTDTAATGQLEKQLHNPSPNGNATREKIQYVQVHEIASKAQLSLVQNGPTDKSGVTNPQVRQPLGKVRIRVINTDSLNEQNLQVGIDTSMRRLISVVCDQWGLSQHSVRFLFCGKRVLMDETPKSLDMEDGDAIEVFREQRGGGRLLCPAHLISHPAKKMVILPIKLDSQKAGTGGARDEGLE